MNRRKLLKAALAAPVPVMATSLAGATKNELGQYDHGWMETARHYALDAEHWKQVALDVEDRLEYVEKGTFEWAMVKMREGKIVYRERWRWSPHNALVLRMYNEELQSCILSVNPHDWERTIGGLEYPNDADILAKDWQVYVATSKVAV